MKVSKETINHVVQTDIWSKSDSKAFITAQNTFKSIFAIQILSLSKIGNSQRTKFMYRNVWIME